MSAWSIDEKKQAASKTSRCLLGFAIAGSSSLAVRKFAEGPFDQVGKYREAPFRATTFDASNSGITCPKVHSMHLCCALMPPPDSLIMYGKRSQGQKIRRNLNCGASLCRERHRLATSPALPVTNPPEGWRLFGNKRFPSGTGSTAMVLYDLDEGRGIHQGPRGWGRCQPPEIGSPFSTRLGGNPSGRRKCAIARRPIRREGSAWPQEVEREPPASRIGDRCRRLSAHRQNGSEVPHGSPIGWRWGHSIQ